MQKKIKKQHRLFFHKKEKELHFMCDDKQFAIVLKAVRERIDEYKEKLFEKGIIWKDVVLEPVNPEDKEKLIADNLDDEIVTQVQQDFFQHAGLLKEPANNYKKRSRS